MSKIILNKQFKTISIRIFITIHFLIFTFIQCKLNPANFSKGTSKFYVTFAKKNFLCTKIRYNLLFYFACSSSKLLKTQVILFSYASLEAGDFVFHF